MLLKIEVPNVKLSNDIEILPQSIYAQVTGINKGAFKSKYSLSDFPFSFVQSNGNPFVRQLIRWGDGRTSLVLEWEEAFTGTEDYGLRLSVTVEQIESFPKF